MTEILAIDDDGKFSCDQKSTFAGRYQVTALEDPLQLEEDKLQIPAHSFRCDDAGHRRVDLCRRIREKWIVRFCFSRQKPKRKT